MPIAIDQFPNLPALSYDQVRKQIRSGDILLCSGSGVISELIKKTTGSVWSHVAFILRLDSIDRVMILESVESIGVRTVPLSSYINNYNGTGQGYAGKVLIARHQNFNPTDVNHLSKYAVDLFGYPYNKEEILRIAAKIGMKEFGFNIHDPLINQPHAYICSEYAYACYKSVGITINYDPQGYVTPADFAKTPEINAVSFIDLQNTSLPIRNKEAVLA